MTCFILKCVLSGIIIGVVSEVANRSPVFGALIVSLPLVSLLAIIWLWRDTGDIERTAALAQSTFWYVLPSLPMFLMLPTLLRAALGFLAQFDSGLRSYGGSLFRDCLGARQVRHSSLNRAAHAPTGRAGPTFVKL